MTRDEVTNSMTYHLSNKSTEYWREHKDDLEEDNGQICDAFEAGAQAAIDMVADKMYDYIRSHVQIIAYLDGIFSSTTRPIYGDKFAEMIKEAIKNDNIKC